MPHRNGKFSEWCKKKPDFEGKLLIIVYIFIPQLFVWIGVVPKLKDVQLLSDDCWMIYEKPTLVEKWLLSLHIFTPQLFVWIWVAP